MANFVYNYFKTERTFDFIERQKQWYDFLQEKEFNDSLENTIKSQTESYQKELRRNADLANKDANELRQVLGDVSENQIQSIQQQTRAVTESANLIVGSVNEGFSNIGKTIESGFESVSSELSTIGFNLENLATTLDVRLSEMIDQQRISNMLLENIAHLLRVPDFQKERQYFIEQGFKHYKNASLDSDLYLDSLKNLLEAEKREASDYVVLHRIGMIYLYAPKLLDLAKAEDYFCRAAKYAIVESNPAAQRTLNLLLGDVKNRLDSQESPVKSARAVAAKAYFQAGIACYAQGKFSGAVELLGKAFSLLPSLLEARFIQAKSLAILGEAGKSAEILREVIQKESFYAVKTVADADLAIRGEIRQMLQKLREDALNQAVQRFTHIRTQVSPDSQILQVLPQIEVAIRKGTYLDAVKALDELTKGREWKRTVQCVWAEHSKVLEYNREDGNNLHGFKDYDTGLNSPNEVSAISYDGTKIAVAGNRGPLQILDLQTSSCIFKMKHNYYSHINEPAEDLIQIDEKFAKFLINENESFLVTYELLGGQIVEKKVLKHSVGSLKHSSRYDRLCSFEYFIKLKVANNDEYLCLGDSSAGNAPVILNVNTASTVVIETSFDSNGDRWAFSKNGEYFAVASSSYNRIELTSRKNEHIFFTSDRENISSHKYWNYINFSDCGKFLVGQSWGDSSIYVWDIEHQNLIHKILIKYENYPLIKYLPKYKRVLQVDEYKNDILIIDAENNSIIESYNNSFFLSDELIIVTIGNRVQILDVNSKIVLREIIKEDDTANGWLISENKAVIINGYGVRQDNYSQKFYLRHLSTAKSALIVRSVTKYSVEDFLTIEQKDLELMRRIEHQAAQNLVIQQQKKEELKKQEQEAERQRQETIRQQQETARQKEAQIQSLIQQARAEVKTQNDKWLFKDYRNAVAIYQRAVDMGSQLASNELQELKRRALIP